MLSVKEKRVRALKARRGRKPKFGIPFTEEEIRILKASGIPEATIFGWIKGRRYCEKKMALNVHVLTGRPLLQLLYGDENIELALQPRGATQKTATAPK